MIVVSGLVIKSSMVLINAIQSYFFFFAVPAPGDHLKDWIDDDGFEDSIKKNKSKSYLFDELDLVKKDFNEFLDSNEKMNSIISNMSGARIVNQYIHAYMNRIKKLRMMIQLKVYFNNSRNAYGTEYLVAKSCWISNTNSKVIKKFSRVVGREEQVKKGGKVPSNIINEIEKELESAMWSEYCSEYKSLNIKSI